MDSHYCPMCGGAHGGDAVTESVPEAVADAEVAEEVTSAEVEIARINAKRDVDLARINAGVTETITETEAVAETAHAEGVADGMREVLEASAPDPAPAPVIVDAGPGPDPEPDAPAPPPASDSPEPPRPKEKAKGFFGL